MLIECGNTRVICTASVTPGAPRWMREEGKPGGWVTAEYQMLPASTGRRGSRRPNSRATEIQRLIGRCLRASVDMTKLGDHSVYIDCDVLDADGGTRCASINGGMVALSLALSKLFAEGKISTIPIVNPIAAISVGIVDGVPVADLNYIEDSGADVDLNVIMAENGEYVELQGTAEGKTFSRAQDGQHAETCGLRNPRNFGPTTGLSEQEMNARRQPLQFNLDELTSQTPAMQRCLKLAREAARSDLPLLLQGETGTGKTLLAHAIHLSSLRSDSTFVSFNASAMTDTLLESQLFGHEKGAFTGANRKVIGKFPAAHEGTLFLDEIADMSPTAQAKILRAVEYGKFEPLGAEEMRYADVRVLSATNRPLREWAQQGEFRQDLYHRLNGITLHIPALRDRREDLPALIAMELQLCAQRADKTITALHPDAFNKLIAWDWPREPAGATSGDPDRGPVR